MDVILEVFLRVFVKGLFQLLVWGPIQTWGFIAWFAAVVVISLLIAAMYWLFKRYKPAIEKLTRAQRGQSKQER